jgi:ribosomal protein L17
MEQRYIKIETNPYKKAKQKFKLKTPKIANGKPVINPATGKVVTTLDDVEFLTRVPGTKTTICPRRLPSGLIETGLDEIVPNPYKDGDDGQGNYKVEWAHRILAGKPFVKRQHILEYKHGVPFDYYTSKIPMEPIASNKEDKLFFEKAESKPVLGDGTTFLDLNNPLHELWYYILRAHPQVANSLAELEDGGNIDAEWYIVDEDEKETIKLTRNERELKAAAALHDLKENYTDAVIMVAKSLELDEANEQVTDINKKRLINKLVNVLSNYYKTNEDCYNAFIFTYEKWKNPAERAEVIASADLYDYMKAGIVFYRNGRYNYISPSVAGQVSQTFAFNSKTSFINDFLLSPYYQDAVESLKSVYYDKVKK